MINSQGVAKTKRRKLSDQEQLSPFREKLSVIGNFVWGSERCF
jgi:hypothetical protein